MSDQAFPGQYLNDEWLCADPENLILVNAPARGCDNDEPAGRLTSGLGFNCISCEPHHHCVSRNMLKYPRVAAESGYETAPLLQMRMTHKAKDRQAMSTANQERISTEGQPQGFTPGLGKRLRHRRKELGLTQTELANRVGTSQAVVQKIENGKSLRPRILSDLATALEVKPAWLMYGIEDLGDLSDEAIELGRAWAKLKEPHRTAMKDAILRIGHPED